MTDTTVKSCETCLHEDRAGDDEPCQSCEIDNSDFWEPSESLVGWAWQWTKDNWFDRPTPERKKKPATIPVERNQPHDTLVCTECIYYDRLSRDHHDCRAQEQCSNYSEFKPAKATPVETEETEVVDDCTYDVLLPTVWVTLECRDAGDLSDKMNKLQDEFTTVELDFSVAEDVFLVKCTR